MTGGMAAVGEMRVGIIGLGAFGSRVAMRLLWSGFSTLLVYDVIDMASRVFCNDFGGMAAGSPKLMAQACDVVITVLPSAEELHTVCFGWEGLAKGFSDGGTVIDLGVSDPLRSIEIAGALRARGIDFLDAPAFGTRDEAKRGALTLLVGGDDAVVERCRPLLDVLANRILRAGAVGSAQAAMALVDFQRGAALLAASEAMRLGARYGLSPHDLLGLTETLGGGMGGLLREEVAARRFASGVALGLLRRNLDIAGRLAGEAGLASPLLTATQAALAEAERAIGWGADQTAVIRWLETLPAPGAADAEAAPPDTGTSA